MVGLVLPPSMQRKSLAQQLLPAGFSGFDGNTSHGYWPQLWQRWLSYRADDAAFDAFLTFLEQLPTTGEGEREQQVAELAPHLQRPRNLFFLFVIWFFREGAEPTPLNQLPNLQTLLGADYWTQFTRWHRKYHTDFAALACLLAWQQQEQVRAAYHYRGVELQGVLDYPAFPRILDALFHAFTDE